MSIHIGAEGGQIAPTVLLPGDPLRAKYFAETLLEDAVCFNRVRGMLGFTGRYRNRPVSVMGTGMGIPSVSIYVHELIHEYHVNTLIRVGTCGSLQPDLKTGDILLAMCASTDSNTNKLKFGGMDYAPSASFPLLQSALQAAKDMGTRVRVGSVLSSDTFYLDDPSWYRVWAEYGILACEMETSGVYTLAARNRVHALSILTVSDSVVSDETASADERERSYAQMAKIALEADYLFNASPYQS